MLYSFVVVLYDQLSNMMMSGDDQRVPFFPGDAGH